MRFAQITNILYAKKQTSQKPEEQDCRSEDKKETLHTESEAAEKVSSSPRSLSVVGRDKKRLSSVRLELTTFGWPRVNLITHMDV